MSKKKKSTIETLVRLRGKLKQFYAVNSTYVIMAAKLACMLTMLLTVNRFFPGRAFLLRFIVVAAVSLLGSVVPWGLVSFIGFAWLLAQLSAISPEGTVFLLVVLLVLAVAKYVMLPGSGMAVPLMPVLCLWKIPYVMPAIVGLGGGMTGFVSVGGGLIVYHILRFIVRNQEYLKDRETSTLVQKLLFLVQGMLKNTELLAVLICFCVSTLIIWMIGRLSVPYSRTIALSAGTLMNAVMLAVAYHYTGLTYSPAALILGTLAALAIGFIYNIFGRFLNYGKTERVQFEDDDYYYYVKAVPKVTLPGDEEDEDQKALDDEQLQAFLAVVGKLSDQSEEEKQEEA